MVNLVIFTIMFICCCYYGLEHKGKNTKIYFLVRDYVHFIVVENWFADILLLLAIAGIFSQSNGSVEQQITSGFLVSFVTYFLFQGYGYHQKKQRWREVTSVIAWNITNCSLLYLYNLIFQGYCFTSGNCNLNKEMLKNANAFYVVRQKILQLKPSGVHQVDINSIVDVGTEMIDVLRSIVKINSYNAINKYEFKDFINTIKSLVDRLELIFQQVMFYLPEDKDKFIEGVSQWIEALQYLVGDEDKILLNPATDMKILHDIDILDKNVVVIQKLKRFVV